MMHRGASSVVSPLLELGSVWGRCYIPVTASNAFPSKMGQTAALLLLLCLLPGKPARAQTSQFLPEVDVYYKIQQNIRLDFQAKQTREAGDPTQAEIGPSLDLFVKPLVRLKNIPIFDPDKTKSRLLQLFVGYRSVPSPDKATIDRMEVGFISNVPLVANILLSDRNRADLDWSKKPFVWRYRNRLKLQRTVAIGSYNPAPYASAEVFFQSQYSKWSTTVLYAGCLFPVGKHFAFDSYYAHQNITGKHPNQQLNQLGLILNMYFGRLEEQ